MLGISFFEKNIKLERSQQATSRHNLNYENWTGQPPNWKSSKANLTNAYSRQRVILEKLINHNTLIPFIKSLRSPLLSYISKLKDYQLVSVVS